ncbi:hypothetical protein GCM10027188_16020 [Lysobacter humi (ex Lee et al. 2017)]
MWSAGRSLTAALSDVGVADEAAVDGAWRPKLFAMLTLSWLRRDTMSRPVLVDRTPTAAAARPATVSAAAATLNLVLVI